MIKNIKTKNLLLVGAGLLLILPPTKKVVDKVFTKMNNKEFIKFIYPYVKIIGEKIGVPPIFLLSQIITETGWGKSSLFTKYFNVGGIKARKGQNFVSLLTTEYINGKKVRIPQNFAVYPNLAEGLANYTKVFQNVNFRQYLNKTTDPDIYVTLLQSGSKKYATDINYIKNIQNLNKQVSKLV